MQYMQLDRDPEMYFYARQGEVYQVIKLCDVFVFLMNFSMILLRFLLDF